MAVPIQFCTVVFRREQLAASFPGGLDAFVEFCATASYLEDDHLACVSFMATSETLDLVDRVTRQIPPSESLALALIDTFGSFPEVPPWLRTGEIDGTPCAWLADSPPGAVVSPPRYIGTRSFRTPFDAFAEQLGARRISIESSSPDSIEVTFRRDATTVDAAIVVDPDGVLAGLLTFLPSSRVDLVQYEALISDLEVTLRQLGWSESG